MARICRKCGAENNGLPIFCRGCGARLGEAEYVPDKLKKRRARGSGGAWLLLLALAGAAYAGYHFYLQPAPPGKAVSYADKFGALTEQTLAPLANDARAAALLAGVAELERDLSAATVNLELNRAGMDFCRKLRALLRARSQCEAGMAALYAGELDGLRDRANETGAASRKDFAIKAQQQAWERHVIAARAGLRAGLTEIHKAESDKKIQ